MNKQNNTNVPALKLSDKQKKFADAYIDTRNASESYRIAYGRDHAENTVNSSASRLLRNVKVQAYLSNKYTDIATSEVKKERITRDFLINQYLSVLTLSKQEKQLNVAKSCLDSLGKITGLLIDQKSLNVTGGIQHDHLQSIDTGTLLDALTTARHDPGTIDANFRNVDNDTNKDTS